MDKLYDSEKLHHSLREKGIFSIAPVKSSFSTGASTGGLASSNTAGGKRRVRNPTPPVYSPEVSDFFDKNWAKGQLRKQLKDCFDYSLYWHRNLVECLFSALKRLFGNNVRCLTARTQRAEIYLRMIAYNLRAKNLEIFYRAALPLLSL